MLRFLILAGLAYLLFRIVKNQFLAPYKNKSKVRGNKSGSDDTSFQDRNKNRIEDADFEELDD